MRVECGGIHENFTASNKSFIQFHDLMQRSDSFSYEHLYRVRATKLSFLTNYARASACRFYLFISIAILSSETTSCISKCLILKYFDVENETDM